MKGGLSSYISKRWITTTPRFKPSPHLRPSQNYELMLFSRPDGLLHKRIKEIKEIKNDDKLLDSLSRVNAKDFIEKWKAYEKLAGPGNQSFEYLTLELMRENESSSIVKTISIIVPSIVVPAVVTWTLISYFF